MNDADLIKRLGGSTKVAELLEYDKSKGGVQRVNNWKTRGIPWKVKAEHPDLFGLSSVEPNVKDSRSTEQRLQEA